MSRLNDAASIAAAALALLLVAPSRAGAQAWGSAESRSLLERAIARRGAAFADTGLVDWTARAHGFVFFLGQIGEGLSEPPRLIKSDQLELEVYWRTPDRSRQLIIGWRDRRDLPTDINYHRDHLGIVMNNFPDLIRLGDGDEVRDVPHPVAAGAFETYEFALVDSLMISLPGREIQVYEVRFRPRDFRAPRIIGSVFLDVASADLVRMRFSFTRPAYRDDQLEDITVAVENSLWAGRYWLPLRQEIEIRRRAMWLDFPARGIIRGRWEIDGYRFNTGLEEGMFRAGPEIAIAPRQVRDTFPWSGLLDDAIADIGRPARMEDFDAVRAEAVAIAMGNVLTGLRQTQLGGSSVSDFVRFNRVEGLALGAGVTLRSADQARELRLSGGAATARTLFTGGVSLSTRRGPTTWRASLDRRVTGVGDVQQASRAVNSIMAQEAGRDFGDYFLASGARGEMEYVVGGRTSVSVSAGWVRVESLTVATGWARGAFARANPGVDEGDWATARLTWRRRPTSFASLGDVSAGLEMEGGTGATDYARVHADLRLHAGSGRGGLLVRAAAGAGTGALPRHRVFVLGGRGTLLGEPLHGLAGRRMGWLGAEWQVPVAVPQIMLGSFAGTGRSLTLAPFVGLGWTGGRVPGWPGEPARGARPVIGIGFGWLHDLVRLDVGFGLRSRGVAGAVDVSRDFWGIL